MADTVQPDLSQSGLSAQTKPAASGSADNLLFTGSFQYVIPIDVPPGVNGMQPRLALQHNANFRNGLLGPGWELALGSIQRSTKSGRPKFDDTDVFVANIGGQSHELVRIPDGSYRAKIDTAFVNFARSGDGWIAQDKMGLKSYFGTNAAANSRVDAQPGTFEWALDKVEDANGNTMEITYDRDTNVLRPRHVLYGGHMSGAVHNRRVTFNFETRSDSITSYKAGFRQVTTSRMTDIETRVLINGSWTATKRWDFAYGTPEGKVRPSLVSVRVTGIDGASTLSLPPTQFTNATAPAGWDVQADGTPMALPEPTIADGRDIGVRLANLNGDGLIDLVRSDYGGATRAWLNRGSRWDLVGGQIGNASSPFSLPVYFIVNGRDNGARIVDLNGDGLSDIVLSIYLNGHTIQSAHLNTGNGWSSTAGAPWTLNIGGQPVFITVGDEGVWMRDNGVQFADMNGDGLADLIQSIHYYSTGGGTNRVWLNTGNGWAESGGHALPEYLAHLSSDSRSSRPAGVALVDINGDGLTDVVKALSVAGVPASNYPYKVYLNTNPGWIDATSTWPVPDWITRHGSNMTSRDGGVQFADLNGDGLVDWVQSIRETHTGGTTRKRVLLNTGHGWNDASNLWDLPYFVEGAEQTTTSTGKDFPNPTAEFTHKIHGYIFVDVNGDGQSDLLRAHFARGIPTNVVNLGRARPDRIEEVRDSLGGRTVPTYSSLARLSTDHKIPFPMHVLTRLERRDGRGAVIGTDYRYVGGLFDGQLRELLGFERVEATDAEGHRSITWFHQNKDGSGAHVPQAALKGQPYKTEVLSAAGTIMNRNETTYGWIQRYPGVIFPRPVSSRTTVFDMAGNAAATTGSDFRYDDLPAGPGFGNIVAVSDLGDLSISGDERVTTTEYADGAAGRLLAYPRRQTIRSNGEVVADTEILYDGSASPGSVLRGNQTEIRRWLNLPTPKWVISKFEINNRGLVSATIDPLQRRSTMAYDTFGHLSSATGPLLHTVSTKVDPRTGQVTEDTDSSNQSRRYRFDPIGRLTKEIGPLDTESLPTVEYLYWDGLLGDPSRQLVEIRKRERHGEAGFLWSKEYFDGLGRTYRVETEDVGNDYVIADTQFDSRGLVSRSSVPRRASSTTPAMWSENAYDALGRIVRVTNPDQTFSATSFDGLTTRVQDVRGRIHRTESNARGLIVKRFEPGVPSATQYFYDALDRLIRVIGTDGNVTSITYDSLGRKLSLEDPNTGRWTYVCDVVGNLLEQADSRGVRVAMKYDSLNRLTERKLVAGSATETGQPIGTVLASYVYDEDADRPYSKGRMTSASDASGFVRFYHDAVGRVVREVKIVDNVEYEVKTQFDALGRVTSVRYPSDGEVKYTYKDSGLMDRVTDVTGATVYAAFQAYSPLGTVERIDMGSGMTRTTYAYHPQKFTISSLRVDTMKTGAPVALQNLSYVFDQGANLTSVVDSVDSARSQNYTYDDKDRVITAQGAFGEESYSYDEIGNFRVKAAAAYSYNDPARPHAVTQVWPNEAPGIDSSTLLALDLDPSENLPLAADGPTFVAGQRNKALLFSATSQVLVVPESGSLNPAQFSLVAWVRPSVYPTSGLATVIAKTEGSAVGALTDGFRLSLAPNGKAVFEMGRGSSKITLYSVGAIPRNQWTFLAASVNSSRARMFVNGYQQSSLPVTWIAAPNSRGVTVGASLNSSGTVASGSQFLGIIDDVRLQGRTWYSSELTQVYDDYRSATTFAYDAIGNSTQKRSMADSWNYSYDADGRLRQVKRNDTIKATFLYDGNGARVKKITADGTTLYIGKHFEVRPDGTRVDHVYAGGRLICDVIRSPAGVHTNYYHADHLGSISIVTNAAGDVLQELAYAPFGEIFSNDGSSPLRHKFTGQELDAETELNFHNARYYDPKLGRFLTPDAFVVGSGAVAFNRYAYCNNNPLVLTDPSGNNPFLIAVLISAAIQGTTGAINASANGQEWYQGFLRGAAVGAVSGAIGGVVGSGLSNLIGGTAGMIVGRAVGGAYGGGFGAAMLGGDPLQGMLAGGVGGLASGLSQSRLGVPTIDQALGGGVASEITGGKFRDGAVMGAGAAAISAWGFGVLEKRPAFTEEVAQKAPDGTRFYLKARDWYIKAFFRTILGDDYSHVVVKSGGDLYDAHANSRSGPINYKSKYFVDDLNGRGFVSTPGTVDAAAVAANMGVHYPSFSLGRSGDTLKFTVCTTFSSRVSDGTVFGLSPGAQAYNQIGYRPGYVLPVHGR